MSIQQSINSMIGSVSTGVLAVKGMAELKAKKSASAGMSEAGGSGTATQVSPQMMAAQIASQNMQNEIESKKNQKNDLLELFKNMGRNERKEFLKQSQHYQSQEKRGGK